MGVVKQMNVILKNLERFVETCYTHGFFFILCITNMFAGSYRRLLGK